MFIIQGLFWRDYKQYYTKVPGHGFPLLLVTAAYFALFLIPASWI